jgi:hypothetical protein
MRCAQSREGAVARGVRRRRPPWPPIGTATHVEARRHKGLATVLVGALQDLVHRSVREAREEGAQLASERGRGGVSKDNAAQNAQVLGHGARRVEDLRAEQTQVSGTEHLCRSAGSTRDECALGAKATLQTQPRTFLVLYMSLLATVSMGWKMATSATPEADEPSTLAMPETAPRRCPLLEPAWVIAVWRRPRRQIYRPGKTNARPQRSALLRGSLPTSPRAALKVMTLYFGEKLRLSYVRGDRALELGLGGGGARAKRRERGRRGVAKGELERKLGEKAKPAGAHGP